MRWKNKTYLLANRNVHVHILSHHHEGSYPIYQCGSKLFLANARLLARKFNKLFPNQQGIGLVARGTSGFFVAGLLAPFVASPYVLHVFKPREKANHDFKSIDERISLVFVDDFICSGGTFRECAKAYPRNKFIGAILMEGRHLINQFEAGDQDLNELPITEDNFTIITGLRK